ncbi:MAG: hypothetical protein U1F35_08200 [Steroidobacteraceae bacterium]
MSVKKWNLVIDVAACHNCRNCFIAAKDEHVGNDIRAMRHRSRSMAIVG